MHLGDLGADVIKIEDTGSGDYARTAGAVHGKTSYFELVNRNKRSLTLDLKQAAGVAAFMRLAASADVIVEGFRPGVVDKLGIGYQAVAAINPRIVYCAITGYGQDGPYRDRAGHDATAPATTSITWPTAACSTRSVSPGARRRFPTSRSATCSAAR
ncbi:MAG: Formyl-coenzyme A transferase [Candidatus Accumulibacter appositus]|uniref:Formyl-coenzyme A transferase n=1 Tax=Candidatus Accumulibacter appositus TaxID=1454003 RepID=A0A011PKB9_9PROT|nr:MAG: Formyl-coenzyme A transferase [Candidatus Accumulibacter appositus]